MRPLSRECLPLHKAIYKSGHADGGAIAIFPTLIEKAIEMRQDSPILKKIREIWKPIPQVAYIRHFATPSPTCLEGIIALRKIPRGTLKGTPAPPPKISRRPPSISHFGTL